MSKKEIPEIIGKKMYIGFLFTFTENGILVGYFLVLHIIRKLCRVNDVFCLCC